MSHAAIMPVDEKNQEIKRDKQYRQDRQDSQDSQDKQDRQDRQDKQGKLDEQEKQVKQIVNELVNTIQRKIKSLGHLELIIGCMFSGKTTELFRRIKRYEQANKKCIIIKYSKDKRYSDDHAATHDGITSKAIGCLNLSDIDKSILENYDVIGIDEGQFYGDIVNFTIDMVNAGKICIISALDGTFERKPFQEPFGNTLDLIPFADKVDKLTAVCMKCRDLEAIFTRRLGTETKVIMLIGGKESYQSVCRNCYEEGGPP